MKALSLTQPWASLVAIGAKKIETRSWSAQYRGPLAIHAAKSFPVCAKDYASSPVFADALRELQIPGKTIVESLPTGCIIAVCSMVDCQPTSGKRPGHGSNPKYADWVHSLSLQERAFGDYHVGRFGWFLEEARMLAEPIPAKGALGLWSFDHPSLEALV